MKAWPYVTGLPDRGQHKTNSCELCLPSFALQGDADWRNMLAVVSKSASWI